MSNKTQRKPPEETGLAPKYVKRFSNNFLYFSLTILILLVLVSIVFYSLRDSSYTMTVPNGRISIELADTKEKRIKGLSGRESLDGGLLFAFDESSTQNCFWMKDMKFSIDMIWLNEDKEVVTITPNVTPETYPKTFCPESPAIYGLEINAGHAEYLGIKPGIALKF